MDIHNLSNVEKIFFKKQVIKDQTTTIPYILIDNFPDLGLIVSLRFLEWVIENPEGVISLPTGKTPEYFIKWTHFLLNNWGNSKVEHIIKKHGFLPKTNQIYQN